MANGTLQIPSINNARTVTLVATHVWNDGNHQEMKIWLKQILLSTIESITILMNWIITPTKSTIKIGGICCGNVLVKLFQDSTM